MASQRTDLFLNRWKPKMPDRVRNVVIEERPPTSSWNGSTSPQHQRRAGRPLTADPRMASAGVPGGGFRRAWEPPGGHARSPPPLPPNVRIQPSSAGVRRAPQLHPDALLQKNAELEARVRDLNAALDRAVAATTRKQPPPPTLPPKAVHFEAGSAPQDAASTPVDASTAFDVWASSKLLVGDPQDAELHEYFMAQRDKLEAALGDVLVNVASEKAVRPVIAFGTGLIEKEVPDLRMRVPDLDEALEPGKKSTFEQELRDTVAPIVEQAKVKKSVAEEKSLEAALSQATSASASAAASGVSTPAGKEDDGFLTEHLRHSTSRWLDTVGVKEIVQKALLEPLRSYIAADPDGVDTPRAGGDAADGEAEVEEDYLSALAEKDDQWVAMMLDRSKLLPRIATEICKATRKFKMYKTDPGAGEEGEEETVESKFFDDSDAGMEYGSRDVFYRGLDGFLGPPNPNLDDTVETEHCKREDSLGEFTVPNYHTATTSEKEYWFVAEPSDERYVQLQVQEERGNPARSWPAEKRDLKIKTLVASKDGTTTTIEEDHRRRPIPLEEFVEAASEKNEQLRQASMEPLQPVEILCARLYTGPMYCKYNTVLRDIGHLFNRMSASARAALSAKEIQKLLLDHQEQQRSEEKSKPPKERRGRGFPGHTKGNLYTTTLHVINSAVLKLGKLTQATTVYRGISFRTLPKQMKNKDPESLTRGGIEYGFCSCSVDEQQAIVYSGADNEKNKTPMILEMQQGMIDRGAELSWLSQVHISPHFPTITISPHISPHLPTSPHNHHISPYLATSRHTSPHLHQSHVHPCPWLALAVPSREGDPLPAADGPRNPQHPSAREHPTRRVPPFGQPQFAAHRGRHRQDAALAHPAPRPAHRRPAICGRASARDAAARVAQAHPAGEGAVVVQRHVQLQGRDD